MSGEDEAEGEKPEDELEEESDEQVAIPALFHAFLEELRQADPDLEGLEAPADLVAIEGAEQMLTVKLPPSFKAFLELTNGGTVWKTTVYGVDTEDDFDLVEVNLNDREEGLPDHLLAFGNTLSGHIFVFDLSRADERGEAPVFLLDPEDGTLAAIAASFMGLLDRLPRLESELAETKGPQPMTVEEWEQFLAREREKLRKLSKTPAKDLTMPDPERVRADLGGKIPVDPRHLKRSE